MLNSEFVKESALNQGFDLCGITPAKELKQLRHFYTSWLEKGWHGNQNYLERHLEKRLNPRLVYKNAQSILVVAKSYLPAEKTKNRGFKFAKYAQGDDYHFAMKDKLHAVLQALKKQDSTTKGKVLVDSGVVFEKYWAQQAGLGAITKNTLLTTREYGSYVFLGVLLLNKELEADAPFTQDLCQRCTICLKACPNQAINADYTLNCHQCISYQTIEADAPSKELKYLNWVYGCDICQDVCPLNKKAQVTDWGAFTPRKEFQSYTREQWKQLTAEQFKAFIQNSAMDRVSYEKLQQNIQVQNRN